MNFMFGGNMFGGWCRPAAFPVMDPFWAGAINGYRTSMSNFFMNMMFNPFMSASLFSLPQMNYSVYPSYNINFNYVPPDPEPRSSLKYGSPRLAGGCVSLRPAMLVTIRTTIVTAYGINSRSLA